MDIPKYLPTDNLYKFIAVFGLIILVFSWAFPFKVFNDYVIKTLEIKGNLKAWEIEAKSAKEDIGILSNQIEAEKNLTQDKAKEFIPTFSDKKKRYYSVLKKLEEIKNQGELLDYFKYCIGTIKIIALSGIVLGSVLMITGFWLWYSRLQVYQDRIIRDQAAGKVYKQR